MRTMKATKKWIAKFMAIFVAVSMAGFGLSSTLANQALAKDNDGVGSYAGVKVVTIVTSELDLDAADEFKLVGTEPESISYYYAPKSSSSGKFDVPVNSAVSYINEANRVKPNQMIVEVVRDSGAVHTISLNIDYSHPEQSASWKLPYVINGEFESETGHEIEWSSVHYGRISTDGTNSWIDDGMMHFTNDYQNQEITIYQYVTPEQVSSNPEVFASVKVDGVEQSFTTHPSGNHGVGTIVKNSTNYYNMGAIDSYMNIAMQQMPVNGGKGMYLGYDLESIQLYGATYTTGNAVQYTWPLKKGSDYWYEDDGTLTFNKQLNAQAILADVSVVTHDDAAAPVEPAMLARTASGMKFIKAGNGYQYRTIHNGVSTAWQTFENANYVEFAMIAGDKYTVQYKTPDGDVTSRAFIAGTSGTQNYYSPFQIGDVYSATVLAKGHLGNYEPDSNMQSDTYTTTITNFKPVTTDSEAALGIDVYNTTVAYNASNGLVAPGTTASNAGAIFLEKEIGKGNGSAELRELVGTSGGFFWTDCPKEHTLFKDFNGTVPEISGSDVKVVCTDVDLQTGTAWFYIYTTGDRDSGYNPWGGDANLQTQNLAGYFSVQLDQPMHVEFNKTSDNASITDGNGAYSLQFANYELSLGDDKQDTVITNEEGFGCTIDVPAGEYSRDTITQRTSYTANEYTLKETIPSKGYLIDQNKPYKVPGTPGEVVLAGKNGTVYESPMTKTWTFNKLDLTTSTNKTPANAELGNAQFQIQYFATDPAAACPGTTVEPTRTWVVKSASDGSVTLNEGSIVSGEAYRNPAGGQIVWPLGWYKISEVGAPLGYRNSQQGYLNGAGAQSVCPFNFNVTMDQQQGTQRTIAEENNTLDFKDQVLRYDLTFVKSDYDDSEITMPYIPFILTNVESGEQHIIITDANGVFDTSSHTRRPNTQNTNYNDSVIDTNGDGVFSEEEIIAMGESSKWDDVSNFGTAGWFDLNAGLWFTGYDPQNLPEGVTAASLAADNTLNALPYGHYTLEELTCPANYGKEIIIRNFEAKKVNDTTGVEVDGVITLSDTRDKNLIITTTATEDSTGAHEGNAMSEETLTITDLVHVTNITPGKEHTLYATLHLRNTDADNNAVEGGVLQDSEEKVITFSTTFTPDSSEADVAVKLTDLPAMLFAGKDVVVYENLSMGNIARGDHSDIADADQTITFPNFSGLAYDTNSKTKEGIALGETASITDEIVYSNLIPGREYSIVATVMDKSTGEALTDEEGKPVTYTHTFTPEARDGETAFVVEMPRSIVGGKTLILFNQLLSPDGLVGEEKDIHLYAETVNYAGLDTTALDSVTKAHEGNASADEVTIVDTVTYENLIYGKEYTVQGTLYDQETGEVLTSADGEALVSTVVFQAGLGPIDAPEQEEDTVAKFLNELSDNLTMLNALAEDAAEMPEYADVVPELVAPADFMKAVNDAIDEGDADAIDSLSDQLAAYQDWYTLLAEETIEEAKVTPLPTIDELKIVVKEAIAKNEADENSDGEGQEGDVEDPAQALPVDRVGGNVQVEFTFDGSVVAGKKIVVLENLYVGTAADDEAICATHDDKADADQTVSYPKIDAVTTVDGSHVAIALPNTIALNTISYENLIPGVEYMATGVLVDKESGNVVIIDGEAVVAQTTFTPSEAQGTVDVEFEIDATSLANKDVVAYDVISRVGTTTNFDIIPRQFEETTLTHEETLEMTPAEGESIEDMIARADFPETVEVDDVTYTLADVKAAPKTNDEADENEPAAGEEEQTPMGVLEDAEEDVVYVVTATYEYTFSEEVAPEQLLTEIKDALITVASYEKIDDAAQTVHFDPEIIPAPVAETGDMILRVAGVIVAIGVAAAGVYTYRRRKH